MVVCSLGWKRNDWGVLVASDDQWIVTDWRGGPYAGLYMEPVSRWLAEPSWDD